MDGIVRAYQKLGAGGLESGRGREHEITYARQIVILKTSDIVGQRMGVQGDLWA
jgi:hypothetical protein